MEQQKNNAVEKVENIAKGYSPDYDESIREQAIGRRIEAENAIRVHRLETARLKCQAKQHKKQERQATKRQRKAQRQRDNQNKNGNGNKKSGERKGWLTAVISLSVATIALATAFTINVLTPSVSDRAVESLYSKSFYDIVEQVDNIDLNLSKTLATNDSGAMQTYLLDLAVNSELAENDIQQLPLEDQSKFYTTKLINQIGDFSKYLNKKLIDGQSISKQDYQILNELYKRNAQLKQSLNQTLSQMTVDFNFSSLNQNGKGNLVIKNFENLQNLSVEYPELIYDGPFSDGQDQKQIKGLNGKKITPERATEIFKSTFADYGVKEVVQVGQTNYGIECFNVQGQIDGNPAYAQISVVGGKLIMYSFAGSCKNVQITQEQATQNAKDFLQKIGLKDMQSVWVNLSNNVYTINFAYTQNGVTIYPDLVKVRVCGETGMVIGLESASYYTNHTQREISKPTLTQSSAKTYLKQDLIINSVRLALVPVGNSLEVLCYEFNGNQADGEYYVYINAQNGKQVEMFKVVYSNDGSMLM